jgi:hypothetical protein
LAASKNRTTTLRNNQNGNDDQTKGYGALNYILSGLILLASFVTSGISSNNAPNQNLDDSNKEIARWTRVVGRWTRGLAIVGAITAAVLLGQLGIFWRTDETQRAIQRAAVTSYEIKITQIGSDWQISPILENAGNSPALNLRFRVMRTYFSPLWQMRRLNMTPGVENPDVNEIEFTGLPASEISLAPHAKMTLGTYNLTDKAADMLRVGTLYSYIFGEVEYFDIFDKWHRTKFCHRLLGRTVSVEDDDIGAASNIGDVHFFVPGRIESTSNQVLYRLCRRNNCADQQCGIRPKRPNEDRPAATVVR